MHWKMHANGGYRCTAAVLKSTASAWTSNCMDEAAQGSLTDSIGKFHKKSRTRFAHLATQSTVIVVAVFT
jgi:hypothetical protein